MDFDGSLTNYDNFFQASLASAGEARPGQQQAPYGKFFAVLAEPEHFSQFIQVVDLKKNQNLPLDKWRFMHYYSAFVYALRTTSAGAQFADHSHFDLFQAEDTQWKAALHELFANQEMVDEFKSSTERHMQSTFTQLALPTRLILNRLFQDHKGELEGLDFGCGLHIDMPMLASDYIPSGYTFPANDITTFNRPVPIGKGTGVDLVPANLEWVRACTSALASTPDRAAKIDRDLEQLIALRDADLKRFPAVEADIFEFTPETPVDFVLTKKMRYQYGAERQTDILDAINRSLKERGYWITTAEENYFTDGHEEYLQREDEEIWVYQKRNGQLVRITDEPVVKVSTQTGSISGFDMDFFGVSDGVN